MNDITGGSADSVAWQDAATRRAWRGGLAAIGVVAVIGVALFVAFNVYVAVVVDDSDALKDNGEKVTATALADPADTLRCRQVGVPITFVLDGRTYRESLRVDSCDGGGLAKGREFTLYVDPADPSHFVSDDSDDESTIGVVFGVVALLGGLVLPIGAVVGAFRLFRARRVLRVAPWTDRRAADVQVTRLGLNRRVLVLDDVDPPELLVTTWAAFATADGDRKAVRVATAPGGRTVVALDAKSAPRPAKPLRNEKARQRAFKARDAVGGG